MATARVEIVKVHVGLENLIVTGSEEVVKRITRHVKRAYKAAQRE